MEHKVYEDSTSKRNYMQPRTQTDFYHTKWTNYQKPDWYHPYNGLDYRSEYLYRTKEHDFDGEVPPYLSIASTYIDNRRFWFYLGIFGLF